eukprot:GGOE01000480.1.p1 GENE.GGOE01000480.1~~GGOE01000480.1.p1  ORF type:complete len:492 (-),score=115.99 GGOE01000480.1:156-1553(-)
MKEMCKKVAYMATDTCSCEERKRRIQAVNENGDAWKPKERRAITEREEAAVAMFQELLRIPTVSFEGPNGAYRKAVDWLTAHCKALGLQTREAEPAPGKPTLLATWSGEVPETEEPAVLLNSHYDVVPVIREHWQCDPFAAVRDLETGRIYGRGTQDMKCVCVQYLLAIEELQRKGWRPRRTVHLSFVPDEEIGGAAGMGLFLQTELFKSLRIGVGLDEGLANTGNAFTVFYGERNPWWVMVKATGPTGHGSRFIPNTATMKLVDVANSALQFRKEQEAQLGYSGEGCAHAQAKKLGDVTTLNLTVLEAGVTSDHGQTFAMNVIPTEARAGFDIRVSPTMEMTKMHQLLDDWTTRADGVSWTHVPWTVPSMEHHVTPANRQQCPWWGVLEDAVKSMGKALEPEIFPAATDSRFLRSLGIPAFGFSPLANTPILLHEHNEYIDEGVFLEGIDVYVRIIEALAGAKF